MAQTSTLINYRKRDFNLRIRVDYTQRTEGNGSKKKIHRQIISTTTNFNEKKGTFTVMEVIVQLNVNNRWL